MTRVVMCVGQVTLRYFDANGTGIITDWASQIVKRPSFGSKTLKMGLPIGNPSREIPTQLHTWMKRRYGAENERIQDQAP